MSGLIYLGVGEAVVESPSTTRVARTRLECYNLIESSDLKLSFRQANAGPKQLSGRHLLCTSSCLLMHVLPKNTPGSTNPKAEPCQHLSSRRHAICNGESISFQPGLWTHRYTFRQGEYAADRHSTNKHCPKHVHVHVPTHSRTCRQMLNAIGIRMYS